jgi:hypothetical protein
MSTRCANDLSVLELKEELRKLDLTCTGCKSELIARLNRSTPSGTWSELQMESQTSRIMVEVANEGSSHERPEGGRERGTTETRSSPQPRDALQIEMELERLRRELELLKARSATSSASDTHRTPEARASGETERVRSEISINIIAELLPELDGAKGGFRMWRDQLRFPEETYQLSLKHMRILIGLRLRGRALAWLLVKKAHPVIYGGAAQGTGGDVRPARRQHDTARGVSST